MRVYPKVFHGDARPVFPFKVADLPDVAFCHKVCIARPSFVRPEVAKDVYTCKGSMAFVFDRFGDIIINVTV